ncbi:hypothetical protein Tco_1008400, partial [Tanacetum coccineum]
REHFIDELDTMVDRFVPEKNVEFMKETQGKVAVGLGGGVPIFQKEGAVFAAGVGDDVPVFQEDELTVWSDGLYFSTSSQHGCPVILSAAGVKKVRRAILEVFAKYPLNLYLVMVMVRILEFKVVLVQNWKVKLLIVHVILQPWVGMFKMFRLLHLLDDVSSHTLTSVGVSKVANTVDESDGSYLSRDADSHDTNDQLSVLFRREVAEDSQKVQEY